MSEKYDAIYGRIRYLVSLKTGITYIFPHYVSKIGVDSHDYLPREESFISHDVIILIKSVLHKDNNTATIRYF